MILQTRDDDSPALPPRRLRVLSAAGALTLLLAASGARAQPFSIPRFDFSFSNPGARSLGFGGAFAALADDATAAYANPAGLVQLAEPEVSLEGRLWKRSPAYLAGGRIDGAPTGRGLDTHDGLFILRDHSREAGPSFASVVLPKGRWSFALYGHQLAKFREAVDVQGFFTDPEPFQFPPGPRVSASRQSVDLKVATAGLAAAWRMNDRLSFGLGIVYSDATLQTHEEVFLPDDDSQASQFGPVTFRPDRRLEKSDLTTGGTDLTVNAGVLGRLSDRVSAGLFYRQGAKVDGSVAFELGPASFFPGFPFEGSFRNEATFHVPDVLGGGLAYRSLGGAVTLATEVDRVGYSSQVRVQSSDELEVTNGDYRDAWEYHFGAEYALLRSTPIVAFRAGYWAEANGNDQIARRIDHLAAGIGIAAKAFQVDLAADFSDEGNTASLSFIYTF